MRWTALCLLALTGVPAAAQEAAQPVSFEAIAVSTQEIRLYWLPAKDATGYRVTVDDAPAKELPAGTTEADFSGLAPERTYRFSLVAEKGAAASKPLTYVERTFAPFPKAESASTKTGHAPIMPVVTFDVVVAQASSGGVAAAVEAARRGLKVALIEPTTRLGGMPVNGLSATDLRRPEHASGFFVRFRDRVRALYASEGLKTNGLQYEPRVAQQAMKSLLYEQPNITVYRRARLAGVRTRDTAPDGSRRRVEAALVEELGADGLPTGNRAEFRAGIFIDATDCGDLAAWAGAPFRLGREARSPQEPHNGVLYYDRSDHHDRLLPGSTGKADKRIQSYAYLLDVKDYGPGADKTIPQPPGYKREDFLHTPAWKDSWAVTSGKMPNGKYELNQHPQGNDLQEINYGYPNADYAERARIEKRYHDHVLGYLYYIQTEQGQKQLGLPDDEYRDTGGFPPLLYVREGRRILGEQLPVENDIAQARRLIRPESVGLGDYPMDSHAVRPKTDWNSPDMGEGEFWLYLYTPWHELPLGILVPQRLDNVFVTTAVSSTHVSFGTYRLEPVRMAFGQAAGIAAALCLRYHLAARDVPARQVQEELLPHAANPAGDPNVFLYYFADVPPSSRHYRAIQYLAARGFLLSAEEFKPDAPTTRGELAFWLSRLAERAAPQTDIASRPRALPGEAGSLPSAYARFQTNPAVVRALQSEPNQNAPVTRAEVAVTLQRLLPPSYSELTTGHYGDISDETVRAAAESLFAQGLDSRLWDGWNVYAPDGKLTFKPNAPLSHADLFETLYIAQIGLGPLFNDNPVDGRNGRDVPPDDFAQLMEWEAEASAR